MVEEKSNVDEHKVVPTGIVEKLIDNIKDFANKFQTYETHVDHLEDSFYAQLEKVASAIHEVGTRLNTPPRHEELEKKLDDVLKNVEEVKQKQSAQNDRLKNVIRAIKIALSLFGGAVLLAGLVVGISEKLSRDALTKDQVKIEERVKQLEKASNNF
jgi:ABC-type hemin transport system substrate-binding protein